jgi:hypothetical protein
LIGTKTWCKEGVETNYEKWKIYMKKKLQEKSIDNCKVCVLVVATADDGKLKIVGMKKWVRKIEWVGEKVC